jgi:CxxC motif-containing protein (DUF1111 family)
VQLILTKNVTIYDERPEEKLQEMFPFAVNGVMVLHRQATLSGYALTRLKRLQFADPNHPETTLLPRLEPIKHGDRSFRVSICGSSPPPPAAVEERNTPALFGTGVIDGISLAMLEAAASLQSPSIRGRPARLPNGEVGRFGWKSQNATLLDFCENACAVELGLETPHRKQQGRVFVQRIAGLPRPDGAGPIVPDMTAGEVNDLTRFVASLPRPEQRPAKGDSQQQSAVGEWLFSKIGCAECHIQNLGPAHGIYSDLLLHRIGTSGSVYYEQLPVTRDPIANDLNRPVAGDEFRTPPLWGVADSKPYLHDGSAPTLHDAIIAHRLQAEPSAVDYRHLNENDRRDLLTFLESLRAPN